MPDKEKKVDTRLEVVRASLANTRRNDSCDVVAVAVLWPSTGGQWKPVIEQTHRLMPESWSLGDLMCASAALPHAKGIFEDWRHHTPNIVPRVPTTTVSQHECATGHSFRGGTQGPSYLERLERVGYITGNGTIPHGLLEVTERQGKQGQWQGAE